MMASVKEIGISNFAEAMAKTVEKPLVLLFQIPHEGPCDEADSLFRQIAGEFNGEASFGTMDVGKNVILSTNFSVTSVPTILIFLRRGIAGQIRWIPSKTELKHQIVEFLGR